MLFCYHLYFSFSLIFTPTFFKVENGKIRFGLSAIKGIGGAICDQIIACRERDGKFTSLENFLTRTVEVGLNKRLIEGFIYSGAFDCFGETRSQLIAVYENAMACAAKDAKSKISGQFSMFGDLMAADDAIKINYPNTSGYCKAPESFSGAIPFIASFIASASLSFSASA